MASIAAVMTVTPAGLRQADAQTFGCSAVKNGTDFDVSWSEVLLADKYVVRRTVDGGSLHWRAAVNAPGLELLGDAEPAQSYTDVVYEVEAKDGSTVLESAVCSDGQAPVVALSCSAVKNGTDFDVSWSEVLLADKYVVRRTVDGGSLHWRAAVNAPGLELLGDAEPAQSYTDVVYEVEAKDGSTVLESAVCSDGQAGGMSCDYMEVDDREFALMIYASTIGAVDYTHRVSRSVSGATSAVIDTLPVGEIDLVDESVAAGVVTYSVDALDSGGVVQETSDCIELIYDPLSITELGMPRLPDGSIGAVSSGNVPVSVAMPALDGASSDPAADVANVCAARLRVDIATQSDPWIKVTIPGGLTMRGDVLNRKINTDSGNWSGNFVLHEVALDGSIGSLSSNSGYVTPSYNWATPAQDKINFKFFKNNGVTREFYMHFDFISVTSISAAEGAYTEMANIGFFNDSGELVTKPCAGEVVERCRAAGGNVVFQEETVVDGTSYSGCNSLNDECLDGIGLVGSLVETFACAGSGSFLFDIPRPSNMELLGYGLIVIGGIVLVLAAPVAVVGGGVIAAETYLGAGLLLGGVGFVGVSQLVDGATQDMITVEVPLPNIGPPVPTPGPWVPIATLAALIDALDTQLRADPPRIESDAAGKPVVAGTDVGTILYGQSEVKTDMPSDAIRRGHVERVVKHALLTCVAEMTLEVGAIYAAANGWPVPVGALTDLYNASDEHLCTKINIIIPAGRRLKNGRPVWQATRNMAEAVYDSDPYTYTVLHEVVDPTLSQGATGNSSWFFLNRWQARPTSGKKWYQNLPYKCKGTDATTSDCDEYPWSATNQGRDVDRAGAPRPESQIPHLRITNASHNRDSGRELQQFYTDCDIVDNEAFVSIPVRPASLSLVSGLMPAPVFPVQQLMPTVFIGPTCDD